MGERKVFERTYHPNIEVHLIAMKPFNCNNKTKNKYES